MNVPRQCRSWIPVFLWMAFIFSMSTDAFSSTNTAAVVEPLFRGFIPEIPAHTFEALHALLRKLAHLTEYAILGFLLIRAFQAGPGRKRTVRVSLVTVFLLVLYATADEFHQMFEPSRTASGLDICIDAAGGIIGQTATALWSSRTRKKKAGSGSPLS